MTQTVQTSAFDALLAQAHWHQREALSAVRPRFEALRPVVDTSIDLALYQWYGLYALALEFQPTLIIELGRGVGNSTIVFTEAANHLPQCRVLSFCLQDDWETQTVPALATYIPSLSEWLKPLDARVGNFLEVDFASLIRPVRPDDRVLVFWDAHGYSVAEFVLGHLLPLIQSQPHVVACHDISNLNMITFNPSSVLYRDRLWTGGNGDTFVFLGGWQSKVEQLVALLDFTTRNQISLYPADLIWSGGALKDLTQSQFDELKARLGDGFTGHGNWGYFSLNERASDQPPTFPRFDREALLSVVRENLPQTVSEAQAVIRTLRQERSRTQQELARFQASLDQFRQDLAAQRQVTAVLRETVSAMQSSKFWRLREAWRRLRGGK